MRSNMTSRRGSRMSVALILSYVFDWVVIIIEAGIGLAFGVRSPNRRPFSLANDDIAFPYKSNETISSAVLFVVCLIAPAAIIFLVAILLVPGSTVAKSTPRSLVWRRKLWEWFVGWTGLALSVATAWIVTNGMKNLFGHWRPDLLSRCNPDIANIANYAVGGYPNTAQGSYLVTWEICQTTDQGLLDDGFRSFPSGHASSSAAGLIYLSLFLASKLAITIPFLAPRPYSDKEPTYISAFPSRMTHSSRAEKLDHNSNSLGTMNPHDGTTEASSVASARNQSATPPLYLLAAIAVPVFAAIYITSTRYSDFRHHGFDLLFGFALGAVSAFYSFRLYHLPIARGAGWAWGPRSRDRAFWAGMGVGSYAANKLEDSSDVVAVNGATKGGDLEAGGDGRVMVGREHVTSGVGNGLSAEEEHIV